MLDVAPRFRDNESLLNPGGDDDYLLRVSHLHEDRLVWKDTVVTVPPPSPELLTLFADPQEIKRLKTLPRGKADLEVDLVLVPGGIREHKDERPRFAYALLIVDAHLGFVHSVNILAVETTLEEMWGRVPGQFIHEMMQAKIRPATVTVSSGLLMELMTPPSAEVGFKLRLSDSLPALEAAQQFMMETMGRQ